MPELPYPEPVLLKASTVEEHVRERVRGYLPWLLGVIDKRDGRGPGTDRAATAMPRVITADDENALRLEEVAPVVVVISEGQANDQTRGGGSLAAWWRVSLLAIGGGATERGTRDLAGRYGAALREIAERLLADGDLVDACMLDDGEAPVVLAEAEDDRGLHAHRVPALIRLPRLVDLRARVPRDPADLPTYQSPPTGVDVVDVRATRSPS